jgi:hypothetical protein
MKQLWLIDVKKLHNLATESIHQQET